MNSRPVVAMVWEGLNVMKTGPVRLGETNPAEPKSGSIRGDFCIQGSRNITHGRESVKGAEKEISLWLKPEELVTTSLVLLTGPTKTRTQRSCPP